MSCTNIKNCIVFNSAFVVHMHFTTHLEFKRKTNAIWKKLPETSYTASSICFIGDAFFAIGGTVKENGSKKTSSVFHFRDQKWQPFDDLQLQCSFVNTLPVMDGILVIDNYTKVVMWITLTTEGMAYLHHIIFNVLNTVHWFFSGLAMVSKASKVVWPQEETDHEGKFLRILFSSINVLYVIYLFTSKSNEKVIGGICRICGAKLEIDSLNRSEDIAIQTRSIF